MVSPTIVKKLEQAARHTKPGPFHCSSTVDLWSLHVSGMKITCGVSAYAQLRSYARFTTTIKLPFSKRESVKALIDTGADRTCISTNCFKRLRKRDKSLSLSPARVGLTGANRVPLCIAGHTSLRLPLTTNLSVNTEVIVCDRLSHNIIIGLDVLLSTRAIIDLHGQSILFRSPHPSIEPQYAYFSITEPNRHYLTLSKDAVVQPHSQQLVRVVSGNASGTLLVQPCNLQYEENSIIVSNGIIEANKETTAFRLLVLNPTPLPIKLTQGTRVARLKSLQTPTMHIGSVHVSSSNTAFQWSHTPTDLHFPNFPSQPEISPDSLRFDIGLSSEQRSQLHDLLVKNGDLFAPRPTHPSTMRHVPPVKIDTKECTPIRVPNYRRHPLAHRYIHDTVQDMLQSGLIEPSTSAWSFPVVLAMKPNGKIRFCIDYRKLNTISVPDAYTIPRIDDIFDSLHGKSFFSSLDAASGFHQVSLQEDSKPKTAFSTRSGLFQWKRLPFRWINAPVAFQRTMDYILRNLIFECALVYIDDIIIYSSTFEQHLKHLQLVFQRLRYFNCQLHLAKCRFGFRTLEYLGHIISPEGIKTKPALVSSILNFPSPETCRSSRESKSALKSFLALANFYRRFIRHFAELTVPLLALLRRDSDFQWTATHQHTFNHLKTCISSTPLLCFPQWNKPFLLTTDASGVGVGAVLEQSDKGGNLRPIQFIRHAFKKEEKRWSMPGKELFAFVFALRKLRVYLYGRPFHWRTDAKALTYLTTSKNLSLKLLRWALLISGFSFQPHHISGKENVVADALSRFPITTKIPTISSISLQDVATTPNIVFQDLPFSRKQFINAQSLDPLCRGWLEQTLPPKASSLLPTLTDTQRQQLQECKQLRAHQARQMSLRFIYLNDILSFMVDYNAYRRSHPWQRWGTLRMVVTYSLKGAVINHFHSPAHRNSIRTSRDIAKYFYWPRLSDDVKLFVASCHPCNSRNARAYTAGLLHSTPATSATHRMSLDIIGPRPTTKEGFRYILVMINHYTKWVVAVPLKERTCAAHMC